MPGNASKTMDSAARPGRPQSLVPAILVTAIVGSAVFLSIEPPATGPETPATRAGATPGKPQNTAALAAGFADRIKPYPHSAPEQITLPAPAGDDARLPVKHDAAAARPMQQERWIRQGLADADPDTRLEAVLRIYELDSEVATTLLQQVLISEKDDDVYRDAAHALELIAGADAVDVIMTGLDADDVADRAEAVEAFGQIGEPAVYLLGQALLGDPDPGLRLRALGLLARSASPAAAAVLEEATRVGDAEIAHAARDMLRAWGQVGTTLPPEIQTYTLAMHGIERDSETAEVFGELAELGEPEARIEAIRDLHLMNDQDAVRVLGTVLQRDEDARVREEAFFALAQIHSVAAETAIEAALGDDSVEMRFHTLETLWSSEAPNILPLIGQVLHSDPNPEFRQEAVRFLAEDGSLAARALMDAARSDPDPVVRALVEDLIAR